MAFELKIPELGENVAGGAVASVLVKVGEKIEKEQPVVELETEKAVLEVPADASGVVAEILIKEGEQVQVGQTIIILESSKETAATSKKESKAAGVKPESKRESVQTEKSEKEGNDVVEVVIPELGENVTGGTVANILVVTGDVIEKEQSLVELETEKAVLEVPSTVDGTVSEILVKIGDEVKIGQAIVRVHAGKTGDATAASSETEIKKPTPTPAPEKEKTETPTESPEQTSTPIIEKAPIVAISEKRAPAAAAPSVRRFAREIGVDIHDVSGSGPGGRISVEDVKAHSKQLHEKHAAAPITPAAAATALPDFSKWGDTQREPMSPVREKTAVHLSAAWANIPHVTQFDKADITDLEKLRKQYGPKAQEAGGKLTMTAILLKTVASALKVFPQFNASVDMTNKEIIYKKYINISVAVDTDRGLLAPVIRDVDHKNLIDLSVELTQIAQKARDRKLTLEEMQGGNFTISNLGGIGGTCFTPIVNAPEVAILGVSRGAYEPVFRNGEFVPRLRLPLSLSYDHRVIDGADGARFIRWIVEALEQPFALILEG